VTKWNAQVRRAHDIAPMVRRAHETALSGRPGPVLLDVPKDVQQRSVHDVPEPARAPAGGGAEDRRRRKAGVLWRRRAHQCR
jgi:acetolactate synthase-1/2/3 large subunit